MTKRAINQPLLLLLAAVHRARPFQVSVQTINRKNPMISTPMSSGSMSCSMPPPVAL